MSEKEDKRRKKMLKKMRKILMEAWQHAGAEPFQERYHDDSDDNVSLSLKDVGQNVEEKVYQKIPNHRQGWEDFARDLGIVYNQHIVQ